MLTGCAVPRLQDSACLAIRPIGTHLVWICEMDTFSSVFASLPARPLTSGWDVPALEPPFSD